MRLRRLRAGCLDLQDTVHCACLSLFILVTILVMYRHFWQDSHDTDRCDALLTRGRWLDAPNSHHSVKPHQNWQPAGCMMHKYNSADITTCLKSRKVVFIGDSVTRQIFWAFAKKLNVQDEGEGKHSSISINVHGLKIAFVWDPYLNGSNFRQEIAAASLSGSKTDHFDGTAILLIGGGLWNARYLGEVSYRHYESSIGDVTRALGDGKTSRTAFSQSVQSSVGVDDLAVIAPIQVPRYDVLSPERARTITPIRVKPIFQYLQQPSVRHNVKVAWSFSHMTWREPSAYGPDGLHLCRSVASEMADILLNARCNAVLRESNSRGYPMDKTCCNRYPRPNWTQSLIFILALSLLPTLTPITFEGAKGFGFIPSRKVTRAIAVLALAICYCYYADRTQFLNKVQKQYSSREFMLLCTATLVLGALSIRRSAPTPMFKEFGCPIRKVQDQPFLSRHQTDEWKGWMQFIILIYHYTGASKILWIYETVRLLVASYLFMTGFGHSVFFYQRSDYSLRRCARVLIRTNMLSCLLPYMMKTDYLFYYFAPLISFWYLVIYLTMAVGHSRNDSRRFLIAKVAVSAILTTALIRTPSIFETLFQLLEKCFKIHWNVTEWRFRLQLDSYIVYAGMLCGIFFASSMDTPEGYVLDRRIDRRIYEFSAKFRFVGLATAAVIPPVFYLFARHAPDKYTYNAWFPYVSTVPVLAYVIFRNISRQTRNFHSLMFAWMGRHSLETFTLQFHIWLGADTKGLLGLGAFDRMIGERDGRRVDLAILTIVFLWVCWHVAAATQTLTNWIIGPSEGVQNVKPDQMFPSAEEGFPISKCNGLVRGVFPFRRVADSFGAGIVRPASWIKRHDAGGLRVRIGIILGAMWLLNMTYI